MNENLPASPDLIGPFGKAWRQNLEAVGKPHAGLVSWLIEARSAHPHWHSYGLFLYHLRDVPGLGDPKIYLSGATHEIMLMALDPREPRSLDRLLKMLEPPNFAAQMIEPSDATAIARVNETVLEVVNGRLSPDTDHLQGWIMRYGSAMVKGDPSKAGETRIVISEPGKQTLEILIPPAAPKQPHS